MLSTECLGDTEISCTCKVKIHKTSWNTMFLVNPSGLFFKHTARRAEGSWSQHFTWKDDHLLLIWEGEDQQSTWQGSTVNILHEKAMIYCWSRGLEGRINDCQSWLLMLSVAIFDLPPPPRLTIGNHLFMWNFHCWSSPCQLLILSVAIVNLTHPPPGLTIDSVDHWSSWWWLSIDPPPTSPIPYRFRLCNL